MDRSILIRRNATVFGLVMLMILGTFLVGCGSKQEVETDTQVPADQTPVQQIPEEVVPEVIDADQTALPDYGTLDPIEYGIEDIFFAFDQYDLDSESMAILSANARILKEVGAAVLISGHCDERGTVEYNLALGEKRARAVKDYLVSLGVASGNIRVTSYGESKPFMTGQDEDAWAQNRRAHFERP